MEELGRSNQATNLWSQAKPLVPEARTFATRLYGILQIITDRFETRIPDFELLVLLWVTAFPRFFNLKLQQ